MNPEPMTSEDNQPKVPDISEQLSEISPSVDLPAENAEENAPEIPLEVSADVPVEEVAQPVPPVEVPIVTPAETQPLITNAEAEKAVGDIIEKTPDNLDGLAKMAEEIGGHQTE